MGELEKNEDIHEENKVAAQFILDNISEALREKVSIDNIMKIFEFEDQYLEKCELDKPDYELSDVINDEELNEHILLSCIENGIHLTIEEIQEIMDAELTYFEENDEFEYDDEEAVKVIMEHITSQLKEKLEVEDILRILDYKDEYFDENGLLSEEPRISGLPVEIDTKEMIAYIQQKGIENDLILTPEEIENILDAELIYLDQNGMIEDIGKYYN